METWFVKKYSRKFKMVHMKYEIYIANKISVVLTRFLRNNYFLKTVKKENGRVFRKTRKKFEKRF